MNSDAPLPGGVGVKASSFAKAAEERLGDLYPKWENEPQMNADKR